MYANLNDNDEVLIETWHYISKANIILSESNLHEYICKPIQKLKKLNRKSIAKNSIFKITLGL